MTRSADTKARAIVHDLRAIDLVEQAVHETLTYYRIRCMTECAKDSGHYPSSSKVGGALFPISEISVAAIA